MSLIEDLKACIRRLLNEADNYIDGLGCCFCDWKLGEDEDIIHAPDCPVLEARELLKR